LPIFKREILRITLPVGETYLAVGEAGNPCGVMALTPPGRFPHSWWANTRLTINAVMFPTPFCPALSKAWQLRRYAEVFDEIHFREPHWYVDTIGVDAAYQGEGIGTGLMRRAIALAEASRLPIWLETQTEANVGYYEGFGFRVTVQKHPVPGGPPTWGMSRT
jgi:ribosomal protein S18 acetylase RimI-like enzyme